MQFGYVFYLLGLFFELHASYVDFYGIAPSNYFFLIAALPTLKAFIGAIRKDRTLFFYLLAVLVSVFSVVIADVSHQLPVDKLIVLKILIKMPIVFLLSYIYSLHFSLQRLARDAVFLMLPAVIVGLGQYFKLDFFWDLRWWISQSGPDKDFNPLRIIGTSQYFVEFALKSYVILFCALIGIKNFIWRQVYMITFTFLILATLTRSVALALLLSVSILYFLDRNPDRKLQRNSELTISWGIFFLFQLVSWLRSFSADEAMRGQMLRLTGTDMTIGARIYMAWAALKVWMMYPVFGLGSLFSSYSKILESVSIHPIFGITGIEQVWHNLSHNSFINFLLRYGIFSFLMLTFFLSKLLYQLFKKSQSVDAILFASLVGLLFNACLHNSSLWDSSIGSFILGLATAQVFQKQEMLNSHRGASV